MLKILKIGLKRVRLSFRIVLVFLFFLLPYNSARCQSAIKYFIESNAPQVNMREQPNVNSSVITEIATGTEVEMLGRLKNGWTQITFLDYSGYIKSDLVKPDKYGDWDKIEINTGDSPQCDNIIPEYNTEINNKLRINVGNNTDVVIKLMRKEESSNPTCIRTAYIRSGESYDITNIPEGIYYLKIAYGRDWRQKIVDGQCIGKFVKKAMYERGKEVLNYYVVNKYDHYEIPSFELFLDVYTVKGKGKKFGSNDISESEFNK